MNDFFKKRSCPVCTTADCNSADCNIIDYDEQSKHKDQKLSERGKSLCITLDDKGPEHKGSKYKGPKYKGPEHKGSKHKGSKDGIYTGAGRIKSKSLLFDDEDVPTELRPALLESNKEIFFHGEGPKTIFEGSQLLLHAINTRENYSKEQKKYHEEMKQFQELVKKVDFTKLGLQQKLDAYFDLILRDFEYYSDQEKKDVKKEIQCLKLSEKDLNAEETIKKVSMTLSKPCLKHKDGTNKSYYQAILFKLLKRFELTWNICVS